MIGDTPYLHSVRWHSNSNMLCQDAGKTDRRVLQILVLVRGTNGTWGWNLYVLSMAVAGWQDAGVRKKNSAVGGDPNSKEVSESCTQWPAS